MCTVFDTVSSNIDEVLSINPSTNVFIFGDFNVHHKDWLTYSGRADRPIVIIFFVTTLLVWIYFFWLWYLFYSGFPSLGNFDHVVSVSINFPSKSERDAHFNRTAYEYSCADWDDFRDHLRNVPWDCIFKFLLLLLLLNFVNGSTLELMDTSLIVNSRSSFIHLLGFKLLVLLP